MLSCIEVTRLISESLDRPLSFRQRMSVAMHLFVCRFCSRYRKQMRLISLAVQRLAKDKGDALENISDDMLSPEARERIKENLRSGST